MEGLTLTVEHIVVKLLRISFSLDAPLASLYPPKNQSVVQKGIRLLLNTISYVHYDFYV